MISGAKLSINSFVSLNLSKPIIDRIRLSKPIWFSGSISKFFEKFQKSSFQFLNSIHSFALKIKSSTSCPGPDKFADFLTNSIISLFDLAPEIHQQLDLQKSINCRN